MPTCWFSTTFSPDRPAKRPVDAVFRCVASGCRSAREPGCLYPKQRTAILRIATFSALTQQRFPDDGPELRPREGPLFLAYARADLASSSPKNNQPPFFSYSRLEKTGGRRQRKELRALSSSSRRRGWRRLARLEESQFLRLRPNSRAPDPKQRSLSARLGDSFYFAISKIVESLLRRGARVPLGTRKLELARQQATTALTPDGRCRSAPENWSLLRQLPPCG